MCLIGVTCILCGLNTPLFPEMKVPRVKWQDGQDIEVKYVFRESIRLPSFATPRYSLSNSLGQSLV